MHTVTVTKTINAPIDEVFEAFTDHERMSDVVGVRCKLVRHGNSEKNGLGAIREVDCAGVWLREEIIGFDRPNRMEYRIRKSRPASHHEFGQVEFVETESGTTIIWTTRFGVRVPVVAQILEQGFAIGTSIMFRLVLQGVEKRVRTA